MSPWSSPDEVAHHPGLAKQMDPDARNVVQPLLHFFPGGTGVTVQRVVQDRQ